jgi:hypothetical protein
VRDARCSWPGTGMRWCPTRAPARYRAAAEAIEAVESAGFVLAHMAYSWVQDKKRGVTVMVFRRV